MWGKEIEPLCYLDVALDVSLLSHRALDTALASFSCFTVASYGVCLYIESH